MFFVFFFFPAHLCQLLTGSCHPAPGHITYRLKCSQSPITGRIMKRRAAVGQWRRCLVATLWCRYVINTVLLCLSQHIDIHCTYCIMRARWMLSSGTQLSLKLSQIIILLLMKTFTLITFFSLLPTPFFLWHNIYTSTFTQYAKFVYI